MLNFERIAIVGLPGSGKSTIARALITQYNHDTKELERNQEIAYIHGDEILATNIIPVCKVINSFVVEHMCLAQLMAKEKYIPVDAVFFLNIPIETCKRRVSSRPQHQLEFSQSWEEFNQDIYRSVSVLQKKGINIFIVTEIDEKYIVEKQLIGDSLKTFIIKPKKP